MHQIVLILKSFWELSVEMAPYLLLGFATAALLRMFISEETVKRHLGARGSRQTLKAALIGVPLPLCSCGVIPVAASIRKQGGSAGAVTSFTASTPQTGVDSIFATAALLNWPFALIRVVVAFVSGVVAGTLVDRFANESAEQKNGKSSENHHHEDCHHHHDESDSSSGCCHQKVKSGEGESNPSKKNTILEGLKFGLIDLPADIAKALLLGLLIAALISEFLPPELIEGIGSDGILAYIAVTAVAIPLYVCSTGSIPMAYALIASGFSPGSALIFLIAGPATNTATISALWKLIGRRAVIIYLTVLIATGWICGWALDQTGMEMALSGHHHDSGFAKTFGTISACLLFLILGNGIFQQIRPRKASGCCCSH